MLAASLFSLKIGGRTMTNQNPSASNPESSAVVTMEGVVTRSRLGVGTWTIVGMGRTVQIFRNKPEEVLQEGLKVRVTGKIRTDIMTAAMVGPVFEIEHFQILEGKE